MPKRSALEARFELLWKAIEGEPFVTEYVFAKPRRFRFDFAWPNEKVAVECEGGTWVGGGHNRGAGYASNCEKYNLAAELGWRVLRYTSTHLRRESAEVLDQVTRVLKQAKADQGRTDAIRHGGRMTQDYEKAMQHLVEENNRLRKRSNELIEESRAICESITAIADERAEEQVTRVLNQER
jgi:very-short-patch-repair endonuclease